MQAAFCRFRRRFWWNSSLPRAASSCPPADALLMRLGRNAACSRGRCDCARRTRELLGQPRLEGSVFPLKRATARPAGIWTGNLGDSKFTRRKMVVDWKCGNLWVSAEGKASASSSHGLAQRTSLRLSLSWTDGGMLAIHVEPTKQRCGRVTRHKWSWPSLKTCCAPT